MHFPKIAHDSEETSGSGDGWWLPMMMPCLQVLWAAQTLTHTFIILTHTNPHTTGTSSPFSTAPPFHQHKAARHLSWTILTVMAISTRGQARRAQPQPPMPPFIRLPDIAHATIASFLPDRDGETDTRLRVSEVSRVLHESYGGSLTSASLYYTKGGSSSLVALLRRQKKLRTLVVKG